MLDLRLVYSGNGTFQTATRLDYDLSTTQFAQGEKVRAKVSRQRSVKQNDYFHALIEVAWANQRGGPKLPTWRHLKSWLLIQVGHCEVKEFEPRAMTPEVADWLRQSFDTIDFTQNGVAIFAKTAKSVKFGKADADQMNKIVNEVVDIICSTIVPGVQPEEMWEMAKRGA